MGRENWEVGTMSSEVVKYWHKHMDKLRMYIANPKIITKIIKRSIDKKSIEKKVEY